MVREGVFCDDSHNDYIQLNCQHLGQVDYKTCITITKLIDQGGKELLCMVYLYCYCGGFTVGSEQLNQYDDRLPPYMH